MKRKMPELALEIYFLINHVRCAYLYDQGGFTAVELDSLLLNINMCFSEEVLANHKGLLVILNLNGSIFMINIETFLARYKIDGDWKKTFFVDISPELSAPVVLSDENSHVCGALSSAIMI